MSTVMAIDKVLELGQAQALVRTLSASTTQHCVMVCKSALQTLMRLHHFVIVSCDTQVT